MAGGYYYHGIRLDYPQMYFETLFTHGAVPSKSRVFIHQSPSIQTCYRCGSTKHHKAKDCDSPKRCSLCYSEGHLRKDCNDGPFIHTLQHTHEELDRHPRWA